MVHLVVACPMNGDAMKKRIAALVALVGCHCNGVALANDTGKWDYLITTARIVDDGTGALNLALSRSMTARSSDRRVEAGRRDARRKVRSTRSDRVLPASWIS